MTLEHLFKCFCLIICLKAMLILRIFYCYITVNLKLYSFVKIDHGGRQSRKKVAKLFSFHFSMMSITKLSVPWRSNT